LAALSQPVASSDVTVDASAPFDDAGPDAPATLVARIPATPSPEVLLSRTPRAGELTAGWRLVHSLVWISVAVAIGSVWKTSDQLGMSTWWLGPRGAPRPRLVQILPFAPAVVMLLLAVNHVRYLAWAGVLAATLVIAVGVVDVGYTPELALLEIAIGIAALGVSVASLTGTYRPIHASQADPTPV
jgi:hypothetical protein